MIESLGAASTLTGRQASAFLGRPFEQRPHDALELPREESLRRVAFARVLDVERDSLGTRMSHQLRSTERPNPSVDADKTLVQEIARNPSRRDVVPRLGRGL